MARFEINCLDDYTDESLLDEVRRVAAQHTGGSFPAKTFAEVSGRVSVSTIGRRFGKSLVDPTRGLAPFLW